MTCTAALRRCAHTRQPTVDRSPEVVCLCVAKCLHTLRVPAVAHLFASDASLRDAAASNRVTSSSNGPVPALRDHLRGLNAEQQAAVCMGAAAYLDGVLGTLPVEQRRTRLFRTIHASSSPSCRPPACDKPRLPTMPPPPCLVSSTQTRCTVAGRSRSSSPAVLERVRALGRGAVLPPRRAWRQLPAVCPEPSPAACCQCSHGAASYCDTGKTVVVKALLRFARAFASAYVARPRVAGTAADGADDGAASESHTATRPRRADAGACATRARGPHVPTRVHAPAPAAPVVPVASRAPPSTSTSSSCGPRAAAGALVRSLGGTDVVEAVQLHPWSHETQACGARRVRSPRSLANSDHR